MLQAVLLLALGVGLWASAVAMVAADAHRPEIDIHVPHICPDRKPSLLLQHSSLLQAPASGQSLERIQVPATDRLLNAMPAGKVAKHGSLLAQHCDQHI